MEMYKVVLKSDTAFFRNDVTSTSYQETFNCPPLATINGLIAAAYGEYRYDINIGYIFEYKYKSTEFELITTERTKGISKVTFSQLKQQYSTYLSDARFDRNDVLRGCFGTSPMQRELLFNCSLSLYLSNKEVAESFNNPFYALLMGRTEDLAKVVSVKKVDLKENFGNIKFGKTIVPFEKAKMIPGKLSKMNIKITETYPRVVQKTDIYNIIDKYWGNVPIPDSVVLDSESNVGVYIHERI